MPSCCVYPFATSRALCRSTGPSALYLTLFTHWHQMALFPDGSEVTVQVLLLSKACNSASIALFHSGSMTACEKLVGSTMDVIEQAKDL